MRPPVLVLVGPTASGKTAVSLEIARAHPAEIVSADSRQIYRFMDIGTAKPPLEQRRGIPHHFIDERNPDEEFSAGVFGELGRQRILEVISRQRLPLVVGGSGLYVRGLIEGFFDGPGADPEVRTMLEKRLAAGGREKLLADLRRVDPATAATIDPTKPRRIIRALEVFQLTGVPLSELQRRGKPEIPFLPVVVGLQLDRDALYARIDARCVQMMADGLIEEAQAIEARGYTRTLNALKTVGYAEVFEFLSGGLSRAEMERRFKQNSRRYAKRQMTWFRRDPRIAWIEVGGLSSAEVAGRVMEAFRRGVGG